MSAGMLVEIRRRKIRGKLRHEVVRVSVTDWSTEKKPKSEWLLLTHWEVAAALSVFFIFSFGLVCVYLTMPAIDYGKLKIKHTTADLCLLKDEATAFSALRNLQDCELNGRRLKVNFAANDKANHQPIGLQAAVDAAAAMAGALGGSQQQALANDPLTVHLSKMSRNQLAQMVSEMKGIAVENQEMAQELLLAKPQLNRALLQAQMMLGMVTPQMLGQVNMRSMPPFNNGQPQQQQLVPKSEPVQISEPQTLVTPQMMQKRPMPPLNMGQQQVPKSEPVQISEPQILPTGVDPALLQQVLSLPPETVASLAPELRQQVIQLQQMYRQDQRIPCSSG